MRIRTALAAAIAGATLLAPTAASAAPKPKPRSTAPVGVPLAANWTLTGVVGAVDAAAGTITVTAPGGNARPRVSPTTVVVPATAVVVVDGVVAGLGAIDAGDAVLVKGVRAGTTPTVTRVETTSPLV